MKKWWSRVLLGCVALVSGVTWLSMPVPLDFELSDPQTEYSFYVGLHAIRLVLKPLQVGDNGDVQIEVFRGLKRIKSLVSQFSFDTLMNKPPAYHRWVWLDGDVFPDLLLEIDAKEFFIGSRDGLIHL